jgi:hypothetical protein
LVTFSSRYRQRDFFHLALVRAQIALMPAIDQEHGGGNVPNTVSAVYADMPKSVMPANSAEP